MPCENMSWQFKPILLPIYLLIRYKELSVDIYEINFIERSTVSKTCRCAYFKSGSH